MVSVLSQLPLYVEVICLEIWKLQKISNNLLQDRTFYDLYTPSTIHCQNTLLKFFQIKRDSVTFITGIGIQNPMVFLEIFYDNY